MTWYVTPKAKPTPLFTHTFERVQHSADMVRVRWNHTPQVGIILGTGLGKLAEAIEQPTIIDYPEIPDFPVSTVESHAGRLLCGTLGGKRDDFGVGVLRELFPR